jgi:hypothetical protein
VPTCLRCRKQVASKEELSPLPGGLFGGGSYCAECLKELGVGSAFREPAPPLPPSAPKKLAVGDAGVGRELVTAVAVSILAWTLLANIFWPRPPAISYPWTLAGIISIAASAAIAYFLVLGRSWARWLTVIVGVVAMPGALNRLSNGGELHEEAGTVRPLETVSLVLCGVVVLILAFHPSVKAFFHARRVTPKEQREVVREWDRVFGLPISPDDPGSDSQEESDD